VFPISTGKFLSYSHRANFKSIFLIWIILIFVKGLYQMYPVVPTKRTSGNFCIRLSNGLEVSKHTESNVLIRKTTINKKWDPQISFIRSGLPSMGLLNVPAWDYQAYPHKTWFCPLSMEISHCTVLFLPHSIVWLTIYHHLNDKLVPFLKDFTL